MEISNRYHRTVAIPPPGSPEKVVNKWNYLKNELKSKLSNTQRKLIDNYPLRPYTALITKGQMESRKHVMKKYLPSDSMDIQTITRSAISEHEMFDDGYYNLRTYTRKFRSVR
jgi:hypothetical protein